MPTKESLPPLTAVPVVEWHDCYGSPGWKGMIVDGAFAHPAKAARPLLNRIFDYLFETGALKKGDTVADPFGGIGTTGLTASYRGVRSVSVELEPKFHALQLENLALHRHKWAALGFPAPVFLCGDSRKLREVIAASRVARVVAGFDYAGFDLAAPDGEFTAVVERDGQGQIVAVVSSPPYAEIAAGAGGLNHLPASPGQQGGRAADSPSQDTDQRYGTAEGQLAKLDGGTVDAVISSPPYMNSPVALEDGKAEKQMASLTKAVEEGRVTGRESVRIVAQGANANTNLNSSGGNYGKTDGQLGTLPGDTVDAVISSPPYESCLTDRGRDQEKTAKRQQRYAEANPDTASHIQKPLISSPPYASTPIGRTGGEFADHGGKGYRRAGVAYDEGGYGQAEGQLGALPEDSVAAVVEAPSSGDTFWSASKLIVEECHALLKPGGTAVWIVKAFVRNKEIVDFPGDWRRLCEHVGFETVLEVRAMLVKETRELDLFGEEIATTKEKKSFFRRLAESKGSPKINYEVCWVMRKPL